MGYIMTAPTQIVMAASDLNAQDPMMKTRVFTATREQAMDCIETTFKGEKGWNIVNVDRLKGSVKLEHKAGFLGPVNDVTVTVVQEQILNGQKTHVNVKAVPKSGKGKPEKSAETVKAFNKVIDMNMRAWTRNTV